jgi:hypothetical protein
MPTHEDPTTTRYAKEESKQYIHRCSLTQLIPIDALPDHRLLKFPTAEESPGKFRMN